MSCLIESVDYCQGYLNGPASYSAFLALVSAISLPQNPADIYPQDYRFQLKSGSTFDFIVVGAGSAGCAIAARLSENPNWTVLLLEAGGLPTTDSEIPAYSQHEQLTDVDWKYKTEPSKTYCLGGKDKKCNWPRGKCLGGSSQTNGMLYVRGFKEDFDSWDAAGNSDWSWNDVLPVYKSMENYSFDPNFGQDGPIKLSHVVPENNVMKALEAVALNSNLTNEWKIVPTTIYKGSRQSSAKSYLSKIKNRKNLKVALNALVEKINIKDGKTTGVTVLIKGKRLILKARKETILSAGSINSPQILMLSGIGESSQLKKFDIKPVKELNVGENLQDHVATFGVYIKLDLEIMASNLSQVPNYDIYRYFTKQEGPLATVGLLNFPWFYAVNNNSSLPDIQVHWILYPRDQENFLRSLRNYNTDDKIIESLLSAFKDYVLLTPALTLLYPKSKGKIKLASKDSRVHPLIYPEYFSAQEDMDVLLKGIEILREKVLNSEIMQKYHAEFLDYYIPGCESFKFDTREYWECNLRHTASTLYHPVGTCKMGPTSDKDAVVDAKLKVHGVKNLRVADASIMPTITGGNTQAPTMMIGEKAAMFIKRDWV